MEFAIFSGRFDPCHTGHFFSISKIARAFDHVIVPILDYGERLTPASVIKSIFENFFKSVTPLNNITFVLNTIHFGEITLEEYQKFLVNYAGGKVNVSYLSGNEQVLNHMKHIGVERTIYWPRFMDDIYSGTRIRNEIREGCSG